MTQMRIEKLVLKRLNQFRNLHLDFRDPVTGKPLEKVCFIGPNGTGKTTLLQLLKEFVLSIGRLDQLPQIGSYSFRACTCAIGDERFVFVGFTEYIPRAPFGGFLEVFDASIEQDARWNDFIRADSPEPIGDAELNRIRTTYRVPNAKLAILHQQGVADEFNQSLVVSCLTDDDGEFITNGLPQTTLSEALALGKQFPSIHQVGTSRSQDFWKVLIFLIKQRDEDQQEFFQRADVRRRTIEDAESEFDRIHPEILAEIAKIWSQILDKAGLEFDYKTAKKPTQLTDNLEAFVRVKSTGVVIKNYNVLSSGMRNFMFRLGHIFALYFNRRVEQGFLFVDEPEDSLYPDFLYDLIDIYLDIIKGNNTQFFVATHSPIIAAQFRPEERFILNFDESYHVVATRGVSPEGDDPNDLLDKDFGVKNIYPKVGLAKWERFVELRQQIEHETDRAKKLQLASEYMEIGNAYNFTPNEIRNGHAIPEKD